MPTIAFRTSAPLSTVQRALDELARSGFDLVELWVSTAHGTAEVRLSFDGASSVSPGTYALRIYGLLGVQPISLLEEQSA